MGIREKKKRIVQKLGYDAKRAQHSIRLLRVGQEWLLNGEPQIYRTKDRDELLAIKTGEYSLEQIKKLYNEELIKIETAYLKSKLPEKNNKYDVNKLLFEVMNY